MDKPDFAAIRERLLRGGVAPKHVRRTIAELQDHHADLVSEALHRGSGPDDAAAEARQRLGAEETIVAEVLARRELRSWAHRWPWALYGLAPLLVLPAAIGAVLAALVVPPYLFTGGPGSIAPGWLHGLTGAAQRVAMFGVPLVVAAGICLAAARRRASPLWPIVGVILVSLIGGALDLQVQWPAPGQHGMLSVGLSLLPPFPDLAGMLVRTALSCLLVLVPFQWLRARPLSPRTPG
jgi:hypothetical protein